MRCSFTRLMLWLLITVLPVQGFTAAIRSCCTVTAQARLVQSAPVPDSHAGMHHDALPGSQHVAPAAPAPEHDSVGADAQTHQHHQHHEVVAEHAADTGEPRSTSPAHAGLIHLDLPSFQSDGHHVHADSSCNNCAACWVGAAAPPPVLSRTAMTAPRESHFTLPSPIALSFIPATPERPPRPSLALVS